MQEDEKNFGEDQNSGSGRDGYGGQDRGFVRGPGWGRGPGKGRGFGPGLGPGAGRGHGPGGGRGPGGKAGPGKRCRFEGRFREHGIKLTVPRQVILNLLDGEEEYLSADEIYLRVHEGHPQVGLATVYRTLQLLENISLLHRLETGDGKSRFKLLDEKDRNERLVFVCGGCGRTTVIDELTEEEQKALDKMEQRGKAEESFRAVQRTVQFYGYCTSCGE
ncbi:MAG: Fur family transcriptional regulator [Spirochaetia bacterium]